MLSCQLQYPKGNVDKSFNKRLLVYTILKSFSSVLLYNFRFNGSLEIFLSSTVLMECLVFATTISRMLEKFMSSEFFWL